VDYLDKKAIGDSFLCLLSLLFKESRVADKAKHLATIINKASMSIDEPTTLKCYSKKAKLNTLANVKKYGTSNG